MNVKFMIDVVVDEELKGFLKWLMSDFDLNKANVEKLMLLKQPIDSIAHKMSARLYNALAANGYKQIGDIIKCTQSEFMKYKNFGRTSAIELSELIEKLGLSFNTEITKSL